MSDVCVPCLPAGVDIFPAQGLRTTLAAVGFSVSGQCNMCLQHAAAGAPIVASRESTRRILCPGCPIGGPHDHFRSYTSKVLPTTHRIGKASIRGQ